MPPKTWQRRPYFKYSGPDDPSLQHFRDWSGENRGFYAGFTTWLKTNSYSKSTLNTYLVAVRQAISFLKKPYWQMDPVVDLEKAWAYLQSRPTTLSTQAGYYKGLAKLAEYLRLRLQRPTAKKEPNLLYFLEDLPEWLACSVKEFLAHASRSWQPERRCQSSRVLLSRLTRSLRWMNAHFPLSTIADLTPNVWFEYLDIRLNQNIKPCTLNSELLTLQGFLRFLSDQEIPICQRFLLLLQLEEAQRLPRDVPASLLHQLFREIQKDAASEHRGVHRLGVLDTAWFLLMLHSGLRTCEVRSLKLADIDWEQRQVRIEQPKGLKDRFVYLSQAAIEAMKAFFAIRGPADALPNFVFIFRHQPLSASYCYERLRTYGERCGMQVTPHQLRHSCATLLLNAGAPILTVQAILGHKKIDTTLGYARLYDGTIARDYFKAMNEVEQQLGLVEGDGKKAPQYGELVALVDSLCSSLLNESQSTTVQAIRSGILALSRIEHTKNSMEDVKEPMLT